MRLGKGLVRVSLPAGTRLSAPAPSGRGTVAILPGALRTGDQLKASAPLSPGAVKRLRNRAVPSFRVRAARVARRSSAHSTDELTRILGDLGRQLNLLTGRVNGLASLTGSVLRSAEVSMRALAHRSAGANRIPIIDHLKLM